MTWTFGSRYSRIDQVKFVEGGHFNFFKDCLPQILIGLLLNNLTHFYRNSKKVSCKRPILEKKFTKSKANIIQFLLSKAADLNVYIVDFEHVLCTGFLGEINTAGKPMFKVSNKNFRLLF